MSLDAATVRNLFMDCLFDSPDDYGPETEMIPVYGITNAFVFNPEKVDAHSEEILNLLYELPETFREETGGGWSFLQAAYDKEEKHWGEHRNMEELFCLGMAIGRVKYLMPRDFWPILPGGVPYLMITSQKLDVEKKKLKEIEKTHFSAEAKE